MATFYKLKVGDKMKLLRKITTAKLSSEEMINRYVSQPEQLPEELKKQFNNESIQVYSYVDFDNAFNLCGDWVILTETSLHFASMNSDDTFKLKTVPRDEIKSVKEVSGLSANRLVFYDSDEQVLIVVRYSHRQNRSMSLIKFLVEQENELGKQFQLKQKNSDETYQQKVLTPIKEAQASVAGNQAAVVWRLLGYLKPYKKQVGLGLVAAVLMTIISLIPAYLTGYVIDDLIKPYQSGRLTLSEVKQMTYVTIAGLIAVYLFVELFAWLRLKTMSIMGEWVAKDLRDEVYTHLHKLSLSFFSSKQTGSLISRVGSDTDRIWDFVAFGIVEITTSVLTLMGLAVVLIYLDWPLGLIVVLPIPFLLLAIYKHGQNMQKMFLKAWRKWSALTDCLSDTIPGVKVVKAFNRAKDETNKFNQRNASVTGEFNNIHEVWTRFWPVLMLSIRLVVISVWVFGVPRVIEHVTHYKETGLTNVGLAPGVFIAFVIYLRMYVRPIEVIGQLARNITRATSSAHRVFEVLDTEPNIIEVKQPVKLEPMNGAVKFKDVSFSYDGVRKILKGISFDVKPGEMIGLVGSSGGGKTTITNLMARFYDIDSGSISIDGVDIKNIEMESLRSQIGMVLQDPYLFHGTILDNIRYANPEATLDKVVEAAKAANAHEFICRFPHAYDTIVGERGQSLSGGERQRVSIARAILRDPKLLILDEATSAVDTETERKIQQALDNLVSGRTVFAIAHRLSTLQQADRLFVIDKGQLVEKGTHSELVKKENGVYAKLVKMQADLNGNKISV